MYAGYKEYALDESYAYCFPNYDAFAKAVRAELQLKSGRKRKDSDATPKRCYLGIKRKALVTEAQASEFPPEFEMIFYPMEGDPSGFFDGAENAAFSLRSVSFCEIGRYYSGELTI